MNSETQSHDENSSWRSIWKAVVWLTPRVWRAQRWWCAIILAALLATAVEPVGTALLIGSAFAELMEGTDELVGAFSHGLWWLFAAICLTFGSNQMTAASEHFKKLLIDRFDLHLSGVVCRHAATLDIEQYEDPAFLDKLNFARKTSGSSSVAFLFRVFKLAATIVQATLLLLVIAWISPWVAGGMALLAALLFSFVQYVARRHHETTRQQITTQRWATYYRSHFGNRTLVIAMRVFRLSPLFLRDLQEKLSAFFTAMRRVYRLETLSATAINLAQLASTIGATLVVGYQVSEGSTSIAQFVVVWMSALRFNNAQRSLFQAVHQQLTAGFTLAYFVDFLKTLPVVRSGDRNPGTLRGEIEVRDLCFRYPGTERLILDHVSLRIEAGETVALVGNNGAGKTTLAMLLSRMYEPTSGSISFDGIDVRDLSLECVYNNITFVIQRSPKYEATAADNIAYGNWEQLMDDPEGIRDAASFTNIDETIRDLPEGYDTFIGRKFGFTDLSGGQWKRLSIARSLAKPAPIVIMDEPTANMDLKSELELYARVRERLRDRTIILISHRMPTVRLADRILVLDGGRVIEDGSHESLVRGAGFYADFYRRHCENAHV